MRYLPRATLLPIPVFAAFGLSLALAMARAPDGAETGLLDRALPAFSQPPIAGMDQGLATGDIVGEVALVNVFASWCGACRAEHPMLMQLSRSQDVPIYGINWKDRKGAGKLFLQNFGNPYAATGADADGALGAKLQVTGVPETYLVDASGRIRYRHLGPITTDIWHRILSPKIAELRAGL